MKLRIASLAIVVFVGTLFALWWAFVRAPGPAELCDHIIEVTVAEARQSDISQQAEADVVERTRQECIAHKRDKIQLRGRIRYAQYAKCVMAAQTLEEIYGC